LKKEPSKKHRKERKGAKEESMYLLGEGVTGRKKKQRPCLGGGREKTYLKLYKQRKA